MSQLSDTDLHFVVRRLPKDVRELMTKCARFPKPVLLVVGGGFIRETIAGNKPNDIDVFGPTKEALSDAATDLAVTRTVKTFRSDNAITLLCPPRLPVQFITRWTFATPAEVVPSFDFTVCQAVVWTDGAQWYSACAPTFYQDLAARRLVYTSPTRDEAPGGSIMRVRKFLARGYNIQALSFGAVIARLAFKVRMAGMAATEDEFSRVLTGLLREVDPLTVVDGLEVIDEHEVVNQ